MAKLRSSWDEDRLQRGKVSKRGCSRLLTAKEREREAKTKIYKLKRFQKVSESVKREKRKRERVAKLIRETEYDIPIKMTKDGKYYYQPRDKRGRFMKRVFVSASLAQKLV